MNHAAQQLLWKQLAPVFGLEGRNITRFSLMIAADEDPKVFIEENVKETSVEAAHAITARYRLVADEEDGKPPIPPPQKEDFFAVKE